MTKPEKPSDFDWVAARAGCSALNMFQLLKDDAIKNVEAIQAVTKLNGDEIPLKVFDNGNFFGVVRPYRRFTEIGVRFRLSQDEFRVESQGVGSRLYGNTDVKRPGRMPLLGWRRNACSTASACLSIACRGALK
jgi:hypothetical protein